jgi:hypothetical protein
LTILIADLGLTALNALLADVTTWGIPIVALAFVGIAIGYIFGREDWHQMIGIFARVAVGGGVIVGSAAFVQMLGL